MPEIVACPECGRKLKVPDEFLGKKVKCPQCSAMFQAEAEGGRGGGGGGGGGREERLSDRIGKRLGQEEERRRRDDDDDRPSRRGRDDDDDRGRSRRGRDEDEDDRPRSRRGRDDDDYDDDRSSRSRRGRDDDDDYDDDRDRDRGRGRGLSPKQEKAGWKAVSFALLFIIISNWLLVGYIAVNVLGGLLQWALLYSGSLSLVVNLGYVIQILLLILGVSFLVTNLVGHGFTLATPGRQGWSTKPLGISSFACLASATACFLLYMLWVIVVFGPLAFGLSFGVAGGAVNPGALPSRGALSTAPLMFVVMLIGLLCWTAGSIVFMFYLNNVGLRMKRNDLAKNAIVCFIAVAGYIVISTLLLCLWFALLFPTVAGSRNLGEAAGGGAVMAWLGFVLLILIGLVGLALLVWYIVLLYQVRGGVDSYTRRIGK